LTLRNPEHRRSGVHRGLAYPNLAQDRRRAFLSNLSSAKFWQIPKKKKEKKKFMSGLCHDSLEPE
jgi:hypothetical protein